MKIKQLFSIIIITVLCFGKINSQTIPANLPLSGTQTGNNEYEAINIQSTQVINSGKTTYTASNEIVLNPGFETKPGSEFDAKIDDIAYDLTIMTYNLGTNRSEGTYDKHADVIKASGADIVAVQEVRGESRYNWLKGKTGFKGEMCVTGSFINTYKYGIALLWNEEKLGAPIMRKKDKRGYSTDSDYPWAKRGYIVAEFKDFYVIATHFPTGAISGKKKFARFILRRNSDIIQNYQKPVYIAGDLNAKNDQEPEHVFIFNDNGFEILNDMYDKQRGEWDDPYREAHYNAHATSGENPPGNQVDLILELNQNPNREVIDRGVPECIRKNGEYKNWRLNISDHLPYIVKVKLK